MRFYTHQHKFYCGIDPHARSMYICIIDSEGNILLYRNLEARLEALLKTISPYREDVVVVVVVVVAVECMFTWYWLVDLCEREKIRGRHPLNPWGLFAMACNEVPST